MDALISHMSQIHWPALALLTTLGALLWARRQRRGRDERPAVPQEESNAAGALAPASILEEMADGLLVVDMENRLIYTNESARSILDLPARDIPCPISSALAHHPDLIELFWGASEGRSEFVIPDRRPAEVIEGKDQADWPFESIFDLQISPLVSEQGEITSRVLVLRDITQRKHAEEDLRQESAWVQLLLKIAVAANQAVAIEQAWETCLKQVCATTGWPVGHVQIISGDDGEELCSAGIWYLDDDTRYSALADDRRRARFRLGEGISGRVLEARETVWVADISKEAGIIDEPAACEAGLRSAIAFPILVGESVTAVAEFFSFQPIAPDSHMLDVLAHISRQMGRASERVRAEKQIRDLAYFDGLTGLPNRQNFRGNLQHSLERAECTGGHMALLFLDLDGFKRVNDSLGHSVGDQLLCEVADRFVRALRVTDLVARNSDAMVDSSAVARLGGDEFTVLLTRIHEPEDAALVARRLLEAFSRPFRPHGHEVFAGASIGIALYPEDGADEETLLRHADTAMYSAKNLGPSCYQFYTQSMNAYGSRRLEIENCLRYALERNEFRLNFQPLRDANSSDLTAAEVLLRWHSAELGEIGPDEFVPIAEEAGLIVSIGRWVLRSACQRARDWQRRGYRPIRIAVNLSGRQIRQQHLVTTVREAMAETGLSPAYLELEITESTIMQNDEVTNSTLRELSDMGVGLALDDFGTGYSSLSYLRRFELDRVKVDRSFVGEIPNNADDAALTAAIIALAHSLRIGVVAEGVETLEQVEFLREHHCDELQGYFFSRPVPAEEFEHFLERDKPDAEDGAEGADLSEVRA